jgi:transposase
VLDAIFWIARTGAPWRDLPVELGNWNSVFRQFRRWTASGLWDVMPEALTDGGGNADLLQMVERTSIRAHHCAAGGRGDLYHLSLLKAHAGASPTRCRCDAHG